MLLLPIVVTLLLHLNFVQNLLVGRALDYLSQRAQTEFRVDHVHFSLFNRFVFDGLYVEDYHGDTLFYARRVAVPLRGLNLFNGKVALGDVALDGVQFNLMQDSTRSSNLRQILQHFRRTQPKTKHGKFMLQASGVDIRAMHFRHRKFEPAVKSYGVNFSDLDVRDFHLSVRDLSVVDDSISLRIDTLRLREKSGLVIDNLSTDRYTISGTGMHFKNMHLVAAGSDVTMKYLNFDYDSWKGYNDFLQRVRLGARFDDATVRFATIAYFAQSLQRWHLVLHHASGEVSGSVANMKGSVWRAQTLDTDVNIDFVIRGLPDIDKTYFSCHLLRLSTRAHDLAYLVQDITNKPLGKIYPQLERLGQLVVSGHFEGSLHQFKADARLATSLGLADCRLKIHPLQGRRGRNTQFSGTFGVSGFGLGGLLKAPKLGRVTMRATVDGTYGDSLRMKAQADIPALAYNGYTYRAIGLSGTFRNRGFEGAIVSEDPNMTFRFDGALNFNDSLPSYNFALDLQHADLAKLHFNRRDSISKVSCAIHADGSGLKLDELNGTVTIDGLTYINPVDTVHTGTVRLVADNRPSSKMLGLYSSFADVELKGRLSYSKMFDYFRNTLVTYLPSIYPRERTAQPLADSGAITLIDNYYLLNVNVKEANNVAGIFLPGLKLSEGSSLNFLFNPERNVFSLTARSDLIEANRFYISGLNTSLRNLADSISLFVTADELQAGGVYMPLFSMQGGAKDNRINMAMSFDNADNGTSALISTRALLGKSERGVPQVTVRFNPSSITTGGQTWRVGAQQIVYDSTRLWIDRFVVGGGSQRLVVDGYASRSMDDTLRLSLQNFDLSPFSRLTGSKGYNIEGVVNGVGTLAGAYAENVVDADFRFDSVRVNGIRWRDSEFSCTWEQSTRRAQCILSDRQTGDRVIEGYYAPSEHKYEADLNIRKLDMALLTPVLSGVLSDMQGDAHARLKLTSRDYNPILNGELYIDRFRTKVDYTNVAYTLTDGVAEVTDNVIRLRPTQLSDPAGHPVGFDMTFDFRNFKNLAYDVHVRPDNTLVLNTTAKQNEQFYGTIYASGDATIRGNRNGVSMNVVASTTGASRFFMPLANGSDAARADFIVFESPRQRAVADSLKAASRARKLRHKRTVDNLPTNMDIQMALDVKPNVEVQLTLDQAGDNILRGRGEGSINLHVNPRNKEFSIYGDYNITEGSYRFSLQNFATRMFQIEQGSHIQWTGDPVDALVDIRAVYKLKASLAPLLNGSGQSLRRSVPVDCVIQLSERLMHPAITFDVEVPNTDPEIQSLIVNNMNTQEMMSTQFLWLIATHSFYSDNSNSSQNLNIGAMGATTTGIEFLSAQLSSLLSTDRFRLAPKYSPRGEETSDEFGTEFYGELIKDRLILEGDLSYDTGNGIKMNNRTANSLTGDVTLSLLLDETGNFKVKAFTRTIDRFDENQGLQESGVGISYRQSFNTFSDLIQNMRNRIERVRARRAARQSERSNGSAQGSAQSSAQGEGQGATVPSSGASDDTPTHLQPE